MVPTALVFLLLGCVFSGSDAQQGCGCPDRGRRSVDNNDTVVVGDMLLTGDAKEFFFVKQKFRAGSTYGPHKWPGGKLRYYVPPGFDFNAIEAAVGELSRATNNCVTFERLTQPSGDYVQIHDGGRGICNAYLGRQGRRQLMSLGSGCWTKDTIMHEFMHALGFYHEHERPDRDDHIYIDWANVMTSYCHAYKVCQNCKTYSQYDIQSIMHYGSVGFSCNPRKPEIMFNRKTMGTIPRNTKLTASDVYNIKVHYGCKL